MAYNFQIHNATNFKNLIRIFSDFKDKVKLATAFYDLKESEATKCAKLIRYDVLSSVEHERVYTRIFYDEVQALVADEQLFFHNTHFSILPKVSLRVGRL